MGEEGGGDASFDHASGTVRDSDWVDRRTGIKMKRAKQGRWTFRLLLGRGGDEMVDCMNFHRS